MDEISYCDSEILTSRPASRARSDLSTQPLFGVVRQELPEILSRGNVLGSPDNRGVLKSGEHVVVAG